MSWARIKVVAATFAAGLEQRRVSALDPPMLVAR
jgi:hypothetical protein